MTMYAFNALDLPPAPPTAPGTVFQDFAAVQLAGVDDNDAAVAGGLAQATLDQAAGYADILSLGADLALSVSTLLDMIAEADAEDYTGYILAAIETDAGLDGIAGDALSGLGSLPLDFLGSIFDYLFPSVDAEIQAAIGYIIGPLQNEVQTLSISIQSILDRWLFFMP